MTTAWTKRATAAAITAAVVGTALATAPAQAAPPLKTKSLATYLTAKNSFDTDPSNYDIVTKAVLAVLDTNPMSPVAVLTTGSVPLTAFLPNDGAFETLVEQLTGTTPATEADAFAAVASLGIPTVEAVLEYHVVPGATITSTMALQADGTDLATALMGKVIGVSVDGTTITLHDYDDVAADPRVILSQVDLNGGNRQIAHGIDGVLLPEAILTSIGERSLAEVLTAKNSYDSNDSNYDILTKAVTTLLAARPDSPVKVLGQGGTALTAFIPNDGAFKHLASQVTGHAVLTESAAFDTVATLGLDAIESVLLYHVVPGPAILAADALNANGATLDTALAGKTIGVAVAGSTITLHDYDNVAADPRVILSQVDINAGNRQVAHGIDAVLLPISLLTAPGTRSLAAVLTAKSSFDRNTKNYDILTAAVSAVLAANPSSPAAALADGTVPLTAFIPNDGAFKKLVKSITGRTPRTESAAFRAVARMGIPAVEQVLLYHVVPGATVLSEDALGANGVRLVTALDGKGIRVSVRGRLISLGDYSKLRNPRVILSQVDINRGNLQVAHGIDRVLMPVTLPTMRKLYRAGSHSS